MLKIDKKEIICIGLGSNLSNPIMQLRQAVREICDVKDWHFLSCSRLYLSKPLGGPSGQPDYYNAVVSVRTCCEPFLILKELHYLEHQHDRKRSVHWGARTLDLDILLYGDKVIDTPLLQIPHRQMYLRNFVLAPLADVLRDGDKGVMPRISDISTGLGKIGWSGLEVIGTDYPW